MRFTPSCPSIRAGSHPIDIAGYANPFDPSDPAINAAGQTVTLTAAAGGLAAGTYLLLPGAYASLPGAYRVELASNSQDLPTGTQVALADGSVVVAGRFGTITGQEAGRPNGFLIQSQGVWRQYTERDSTLGSSYSLPPPRRKAPPHHRFPPMPAACRSMLLLA